MISLADEGVSIPHRLATNFIIGGSMLLFHLFQFLIGWLQTINNYANAFYTREFQFLIGWLQTWFISRNAFNLFNSFNSL